MTIPLATLLFGTAGQRSRQGPRRARDDQRCEHADRNGHLEFWNVARMLKAAPWVASSPCSTFRAVCADLLGRGGRPAEGALLPGAPMSSSAATSKVALPNSAELRESEPEHRFSTH